MKKMVAWILALAMLLCFGAAAAEGEVPDYTSELNLREIASEDDAIAFAKEFWAMDYVREDLTGAEFTVKPLDDDSEYWCVTAVLPGGKALDLAFEGDGSVVCLDNSASGWAEAEEEDVSGEEEEDEPDEEGAYDEGAEPDEFVLFRENLDRKLEFPFVREVNPRLYETYVEEYPIDEGNNEFLTHYYGTLAAGDSEFDVNYSEAFMDGDSVRMKIVVQTKPVIRIVYFDSSRDAEEGGNG